MAQQWSQLWLPFRSGRGLVRECCLAGRPWSSTSPSRTSTHDNPNTWPFSRPRLAAVAREHGLRWWVSWRSLTLLPCNSSRERRPLTTTLVPPHPFHLRGWRTDQGSLFSLDLSPSSPRVLRSPTESLAVRNALFVAGFFACPSSPCAPFPVSSLPCLCADTVWLVLWLVTVPRSLSDGRSSGVRWTRPFSFSDSSLVGLRPFLLPVFHPARARRDFVALSCPLRYWLGFYLN